MKMESGQRRYKAHMLSEIKSTTNVRRMVFLDTETTGTPTDLWKGKGTPKLHLLRLGWAIFWKTGEEYSKEFKTPDQFFDDLEDFIGHRQKAVFVYSYNASFDYQILGVIKRITEREGWHLKRAPIDKPFIIEATCNGSVVWFLDMGNHLGTRPKLAKIGEELGLEKIDVDASKLDQYSDEEVSTYCKRDAEIVRTWMLEWMNFLKDNDLGPYRPSIAAQCLTTFRHRFIDNPIYIHHHPEASQIERASYKGGRNEAFFLGNIKHAYKLDVNSFHPYIMAEKELPCRLAGGLVHPKAKSLSGLLDQGTLFLVQGKFFVPTPVISVRRVVAPRIERTIFPVGTFSATITSMEYAQLLSVGGSLVEGEMLLKYSSSILFKSYIDYFYSLRLKYKSLDNKTLDTMSKYFMNSLEGKFAQHVPLSMEVTGPLSSEDIEVFDESTGATFSVKVFGDRKWMYTRTKRDSANTFTAISSFIRAYTRTILYDDIRYIHSSGGEVYYVDTDSIFCDRVGYEALCSAGRVSPSRLGAYKLEEEGPLTIHGAKDYLFNGHRAIKGIREDAVEKDGVFKQVHFVRMTGMRARGIDEGVIIVDNFEKRPTRKYHKGVRTASGWVEPLVINE
jgi:hypothetical protein